VKVSECRTKQHGLCNLYTSHNIVTSSTPCRTEGQDM